MSEFGTKGSKDEIVEEVSVEEEEECDYVDVSSL